MAWMSDAAIRRQIAAANQRRWQFGDLSQYITQWQPYRGQQVVLCCRVSERTQDHNGNLADAENGLCQIAESHGVIVVDVVRYVGSGCDPIWLARAAAIAKQHGAILVAESANRFIRHPAYAGEGWLDNVAREVELDELRFCTDGVALATLVPPGEPSRGALIKRGQSCKGRRGGRPTTHQRGWLRCRKAELLPDVLRMRREGNSYAAIATALKLPRQTVARWCCTFFAEPADGDNCQSP